MLAQSMRHRREWKSFAINFNVSTSSKSTDLGGPDLTSNTHAEHLLWSSASPKTRARAWRWWKLLYFPADALHNIFPQLFDLTGIWVAIQALAYGACKVHDGVSAFSPALSRVTTRNTITRALSSAEVMKPDWGAGSAGSACHLHQDAGSWLATYELLNVVLISPPHNLTQSCKIHKVHNSFGNTVLGTAEL